MQRSKWSEVFIRERIFGFKKTKFGGGGRKMTTQNKDVHRNHERKEHKKNNYPIAASNYWKRA